MDMGWDKLHLMISRSTTPDIIKMVTKVEEFLSQQLHSSKRVFISMGPLTTSKAVSVKSKSSTDDGESVTLTSSSRVQQNRNTAIGVCARKRTETCRKTKLIQSISALETKQNNCSSVMLAPTLDSASFSSIVDRRDSTSPPLAESARAGFGLQAVHVQLHTAGVGHQPRRLCQSPWQQLVPRLFPWHQLPLQVVGALHHGRTQHPLRHWGARLRDFWSVSERICSQNSGLSDWVECALYSLPNVCSAENLKCTDIQENLTFQLGHTKTEKVREKHMATILKVSRGHYMPPPFTSVQEWFHYAFSTTEIKGPFLEYLPVCTILCVISCEGDVSWCLLNMWLLNYRSGRGGV